MLAAVMSGTAALGNALGTPGLLGEARDVVILSGAVGVAAVGLTGLLVIRTARSART